MPDLIHLVYSSTAVHPMTRQDLVHLLEQAREKNQRLNVTGMLLYQDQSFVQILEGARPDVEAVYQSILRDPRHRDVTLLMKNLVESREYSSWNMKFSNLETLDLDKVPGYETYAKQPTGLKQFEINNFNPLFLNVFKNL